MSGDDIARIATTTSGDLSEAGETTKDTSTRLIPALSLDRMQLVPGIERPAKTVKYDATAIDHLAVDEICELMIEGIPLTTICSYVAHLPTLHVVQRWLQADSAVAARIDQARSLGIDSMIDSTVLIADTDVDSSRAAVRIKARQWVAERLRPKKYGTKLDVNVAVEVNAEQQRAAAIARARSVRDQLNNWASQVIDGQAEKVDDATD